MTRSWLRALAARLRPGTAQAPPAGEAGEGAAPAELIDPGELGVDDMKLSGWLNFATGEVAPGFPISENDVVVDVGAGDGGFSSFAAPLARETILVDHDRDRLEHALERLKGRGCTRIRGTVADASSLGLPDAMASRVICTEVLEHVDDPDEVMAELLRIGRPGALYLLSAPGAASERLQTKVAPPSYFEKPNHIRIFDPEDFERLVERHGLVIESRSSQGFFWTMWWMFFWQAGIEFGAGTHPLLEAWNRTWSELLKSPDAARVKHALDGLAPKVNALVARKPA